ncbi:hypothetical protein QZH41_002221 [Actinostola sp. cb2023]|nr:hypothetical protein QZH41_002221 [Actinostola sp. cb2023]
MKRTKQLKNEVIEKNKQIEELSKQVAEKEKDAKAKSAKVRRLDDKMDVEAVSFASNEAIHQLGLEAKGDVFALKAFRQRHISKQDQVHAVCGYDDRKRKLIEVLKKGREKEVHKD